MAIKLDLNEKTAARLLWRRQFFLGARPSPRLSTWPSVSVCGRWTIQAHSDLALTQVKNGTVELTLLGDLIDPQRPDYTNTQVLQSIAARLRRATDAPDLTVVLGGRWALIVDDGSTAILFHDPGGLRQVFYGTQQELGPVCASQAEHVANALGLARDSRAEREFLSSDYVRWDPEWW